MKNITNRTSAFLLAGTLAFVAGVMPLTTLAAEKSTPKVITVTPANSQVNINKADAQTLADLLVGVGLSKAKAIVKYRDEHGRFTSLEQLKEVKGIGQSLINANKERMALE